LDSSNNHGAYEIFRPSIEQANGGVGRRWKWRPGRSPPHSPDHYGLSASNAELGKPPQQYPWCAYR